MTRSRSNTVIFDRIRFRVNNVREVGTQASWSYLAIIFRSTFRSVGREHQFSTAKIQFSIFKKGLNNSHFLYWLFVGVCWSAVTKYWPSGLIYGITCTIFDANESILTQTRLLYFGNLAQESRSRLHLETRGSPHWNFQALQSNADTEKRTN